MGYQEEVENSPMPKMSDLNSRIEDQFQLVVLTCLEYILIQVLERVGERTISPVQGVVTKSTNTLESNLEIESNQTTSNPRYVPYQTM